MIASLPKGYSVVVPIVAGVGNALMATPMVRQLKSHADAGRVTVVARTGAMAEPFRRLVEVDGVEVGKTQAMIAAMRRVRADVCVVPFPSNRWQYSMLALASGARRRLLHGYPTGRLRALHAIGVRVPAVRGLHDVEQNLRLLRALGAEPELGEAPRFVVSDDDRSTAAALVQLDRFIAVHAGSARNLLAEAKRWPTDRYAELVARTRRELGLGVVILEGPDEAGVGHAINTLLGAAPAPVASLVGNLGVAAAVLERAQLYVGTDSGLGHLAAAVGRRAVTLFAPADPERVCPFGNRDLVVKPNRTCSPCLQYPWSSTYPKMRCGVDGRNFCIEEVSVDQVMDALAGALSNKGRGRDPIL